MLQFSKGPLLNCSHVKAALVCSSLFGDSYNMFLLFDHPLPYLKTYPMQHMQLRAPLHLILSHYLKINQGFGSQDTVRTP